MKYIYLVTAVSRAVTIFMTSASTISSGLVKGYGLRRLVKTSPATHAMTAPRCWSLIGVAVLTPPIRYGQ